MKVQQQKDLEAVHKKIEDLPPFVVHFARYKLDKKLSPTSVLAYLMDIDTFFNWIKLDLYHNVIEAKEIDKFILEKLTMENILNYQEYLGAVVMLLESSIARKMQSIRSFFNYLHDVAEDDAGKALIEKNVFRKITSHNVSTQSKDARGIMTKVLNSIEIDNFISFIRTQFRIDYASNLQAIWNYDRNKNRDICIVSLLLKAGLLLSDVVNLNLSDISVKDCHVVVTRQRIGHKSSHTIHLESSTMSDLKEYLLLRVKLYHPDVQEQAMFLAIPNGMDSGKRMTKRGIQDMVVKYANKFGNPAITSRQLRHSFGLQYLKQCDIFQTKEQLALKSIRSIEKYQVLSELVD